MWINQTEKKRQIYPKFRSGQEEELNEDRVYLYKMWAVEGHVFSVGGSRNRESVCGSVGVIERTRPSQASLY